MLLAKQAVHFYLISLAAVAVSAVVSAEEAVVEASIQQELNIGQHPLVIRGIEDYEAKVIDREEQEVRDGCETCRPWFLQFCVPGNARCERAAGVWSEFHTRNRQEFNVATVDCEGDEANDLCQLFKITQYPTFVFLAGKEMYYYRGVREHDAFYEFASSTFRRSSKEDVFDVPIHEVILREEDMTTWQLLWKKLYDFDAWVDDYLEGSDFDIIPKTIRYTFIFLVASTSTASVIYVAFFDDQADMKETVKKMVQQRDNKKKIAKARENMAAAQSGKKEKQE